MAHRSVHALLVTLLCLAAVLPSSAGALQPPAGEEPASPETTNTYTDLELLDRLEDVGLTGDWLRTAEVSDEAALVLVVGNSSYLQARSAFLEGLNSLGERGTLVAERVTSIDAIEGDTLILEELIRSLRRELAATGRSAAASITVDLAAETQVALAGIAGSRRSMAPADDPLSLAEQNLVSVRDAVGRVVDGRSRADGRDAKTPDGDVAKLTELYVELQRVHVHIASSRESSIRAQLEIAAQRADVIALMPGLHQQRLLSTSIVGGLPVVSLDAYVRGAEVLDDSCPIEWNLLAGIGRVESFHGTIGGSVVQASGRVSTPILGPLLDGGATRREAIAAAAAAEAALLAEAEAANAEDVEEEDQDPVFDSTVWGDDTLTRAEEVRDSAESTEAVGLAAPPVEVEETPAPRYDPLLWGDELPFDEDDLPPIQDGDSDGSGAADEDGDQPVFRGNGFAVIHDSDNGVFDGNSRWDRAVGPMQFIPETWSYWETDGNGDGRMDPQNLYDAAASAGRFLCHLSRTKGGGPYNFVLGYNGSDTYVRNVMAVADAFGASPLPVVPED